MMRINTNINTIDTQKNLNTVNASLSKSIERLSSGLRINRAGGDAAGLTISDKLRSMSSNTMQSNSSVSESSITSAQSMIRDVDVASEVIQPEPLKQFSNSMLAQANMQPASVLNLLM